jgi:hypothetical protein
MAYHELTVRTGPVRVNLGELDRPTRTGDHVAVTPASRVGGTPTGDDRGLGREMKELALEEDQLDLSGCRAGRVRDGL